MFLLRLFIGVFHAEACEGAIDANREELAVIVVQSHSLNLLRVRLHLQDFFHRLIRVTENLN